MKTYSINECEYMGNFPVRDKSLLGRQFYVDVLPQVGDIIRAKVWEYYPGNPYSVGFKVKEVLEIREVSDERRAKMTSFRASKYWVKLVVKRTVDSAQAA